jgi:type IV fimbrial biogenesis protein FimT
MINLARSDAVKSRAEGNESGTMKIIKYGGFTLTELMVTITISAILLAVAVPSFKDMINNNRISAQTNELVSDLTLARSEAVKRGIAVTLCISTDRASCTGGTNWGPGRILFVDSNRDGVVSASGSTPADLILRAREPMSGTSTLVSTNFANAAYITYLPSGALDFTGVGTVEGTFTLCSAGYKGRLVSVNAIGHIRTVKTAAVC